MGKTLTKMLDEALNFEREPESEAEGEAIERELTAVKDTIKEWLKDVVPRQGGSLESFRRFLITMVDEP